MQSCSSSTRGRAVNTLHSKRKNHWNAPNWTRSRRQESAIRDAYGTYPTLGCIIPGNRIRSMWCSIRQPSSKGSHSIRNSFLVHDLMNSLVGVLIRFCQDNIAMMCDINQMFKSFHVDPKHQNFLPFLWFKDNPSKRIINIKMTVHLFSKGPVLL